jgi:hypothetical protein
MRFVFELEQAGLPPSFVQLLKSSEFHFEISYAIALCAMRFVFELEQAGLPLSLV